MSITEGNYFLPDFQPPRSHFLSQNRYVFCHSLGAFAKL
jgi:hypothetical protein